MKDTSFISQSVIYIFNTQYSTESVAFMICCCSYPAVGIFKLEIKISKLNAILIHGHYEVSAHSYNTGIQ